MATYLRHYGDSPPESIEGIAWTLKGDSAGGQPIYVAEIGVAPKRSKTKAKKSAKTKDNRQDKLTALQAMLADLLTE